MSNVFIFGATGYIGFSLATSLTRSGNYTVYGLSRTPAGAKLLSQNEIIPVLGSFTDNAAYLSTIASAPIDVIVNCAESRDGSIALLKELKAIASARAEAAKVYGIKAPKLSYIYVSGTWVHGSSMDHVNDLDLAGTALSKNKPAELVAWRAAHELDILAASDVLEVAIIRPALIYGRKGAIWTALFQSFLDGVKASSSNVSVLAEPESRPGLVHIDDVVSGLHLAVDKLPLNSGTTVYPVFDLVTSQERMQDVLDSVAKEIGFKGKVELVGTQGNSFMAAMSTTFNGSSGRARQLLGWEPKKIGMVQNAGTYARAWVAGLGEAV